MVFGNNLPRPGRADQVGQGSPTLLQIAGGKKVGSQQLLSRRAGLQFFLDSQPIGWRNLMTAIPKPQVSAFSPADARRMVKDLFVPRPLVYWFDFLGSVSVGYAAVALYFQAPWLSLSRWVCLAVAVPALYRVALFMHEIVHFKHNQMRAFRVVWNVVAGIPMLSPSFFYETHSEHHNAHEYGTGRDGEYLPLGHGTWRDILLFLSQVFVQPILVAIRFLILTPVSFLHPALRQWTLEYASSFVINLWHRRKIPADAPRTAWAWVEWACFLRTAAIFVFIAVGINPWYRVVELYLIAVSILAMNHFRTLAAHRYQSEGDKMSFADQFFDSTIVTGGPVLTELLCPLGLRYHALHHLFPSLPYHNLGKAHRRLMSQLPADSPYRSIVYPSVWSVLRELFQNLPAARHERPSGSRRWYALRSEHLVGQADPQITQSSVAAEKG
jgi:fatty acid desaturase